MDESSGETERIFPSKGDSVWVDVRHGGHSTAGERHERVLQVSVYGLLVSIRARRHIEEWERHLYAGQAVSITEYVAFYPWTNITSVKPGAIVDW